MNNREFKLSEAEQGAIQQREAATTNVRELKRLQAVRLYGRGQAMNAVVNVVAVAAEASNAGCKLTRKAGWQG